MRSSYLASTVLVLLSACSSSPSNNAPGGGATADAGVEGGGSQVCVPGLSDERLRLDTATIASPAVGNSQVSLAVGDGTLGVAYFDASKRVNVELVSSDGTTRNVRIGGTVSNSISQAYRTAIAYRDGVFGVAFSMERDATRGADTVWSSVGFSAVSVEGGTASAATMANNNLDRSAEPVIAGEPFVATTSTGLLPAWVDRRTAEPTRLNVNIAGWGGIYGRNFTSTGEASTARDVQVQQEGLPRTAFKILPTRAGLLALWASSESGADARILAKQGPADGNFAVTPASAPRVEPLLTIPRMGPSNLAGAVGADGNVLLAFSLSKLQGGTSSPLVAVLVGPDGRLISNKPIQVQASAQMGRLAVAASEGGYKLAYEADAPEGRKIYIADVDAAGMPGAQSSVAMDGPLADMVLETSPGRTALHFATGEKGTVALRSFTLCGP